MDSVALILIGSELTRGIIQDRHAQLVSRAVTQLGLHMSQIVAVPDDGSIAHVLSAIVRKNDVVIMTGGLGPTSDDMTRESIAEVAGVPLERNKESWDALSARIGEKIQGANEKQTLVPRGFTRIANPNGTADAFYGYSPSGCLLISLPGPPKEMAPLFEDVIVPLLGRISGHSESVRREYTSFITAEAKLEDLTQQVDPSLQWATRFQDEKITLYLSGGGEEEMDKAIAALRNEVGSCLVQDGDVDAIGLLTETLKTRGLTLSCAESCTGGLAAGAMTRLPGSSDHFLGGVVSYSNEMKEKILSVDPGVISRHGAVSEECALAMARGVKALSSSDAAFSITGVAGPGESERKKVGTVCFAFSAPGQDDVALTLHFSSWGRASVRNKSVIAALLLMREHILGHDVRTIAASWRWA